MNQGTSASVRALQISLVRQEIDSQAETLRFLSSSYISAFQEGSAPNVAPTTPPAAEYYKMMQAVTTDDVTSFGSADGNECPAAPARSFVLNTRTARYQAYSGELMRPAEAFSQVVYNGATLTTAQGIWIEAVRSRPSADVNQANTRYTDFHIRACWDAPGAGMPMNLGTIVRLYEPVNS